ncbi:recombinase family protein [Streptomyces sp. ISL-11]|uniref:recombinase family protein n=1 Tax=Streptomyces sp. ISL-11 TaxID=2819174 RepID=UPI0027E50D32|nr:recombinase family protein [Streptomyces sp. ISL-11]
MLKVYPENDTSASTTSKRRRKVYLEMLRDARSGVIDGIVVYSIDRLTRRITELTHFLEEQKELGFAFAATEGEDTATANGRMISTIKGAVAQQETERMSERINNSLLQRREMGKPHKGGSRMFGFGPNNEGLDDWETELIQRGHDMFMAAAGPATPGDVGRMWDSAGSRTPEAGRPWTNHSVKRGLPGGAHRRHRHVQGAGHRGQHLPEPVDTHGVAERQRRPRQLFHARP